LGPMVYGAAFCQSKREQDLKELGVADSKTLTEEKRDLLFEKIKGCDFLGWFVTVMSAKELSGGMLQRNPYNLNAQSHDTAIALIKRGLAIGLNLKRVFVDTVGDPQRYEDKLSALFPSIQFAVRKKADSLFPTVSAASICAKVVRDRILAQWVSPRPPCPEAEEVRAGSRGTARLLRRTAPRRG
jgi:ribonuclease H2 subunit A